MDSSTGDGAGVIHEVMIVRDHLPVGRIWPRISKQLGVLFLFGAVVTVLHVKLGWRVLSLPGLPLGMIGGALSIFLAFRNNSAYDRWWEARTLWGGLVNTARTFTRQVLTLVDATPARGGTRKGADGERRARELTELQIAYVHALRCHLRRQTPFPELIHGLPPQLVAWLRTQKNVPLALLLEMGRELRTLFDEGLIDSFRFATLDGTLGDLCNIQGGCERIKNTPLPRQYEYFPRLLVAAYCFLLPFGLVDGLQLLTPLVSTLVSFIFLSLESVGKDIEDPFENTVHDTPMSALSRTIEINLRQNLGDRNVPPEVEPVDGFVY
jgi:ion channel-forming bestrophin family protein